tara:strand:- start:2415 stop:2708 length:294 start_codon:yes stop_codon:yes gene_type:complete
VAKTPDSFVDNVTAYGIWWQKTVEREHKQADRLREANPLAISGNQLLTGLPHLKRASLALTIPLIDLSRSHRHMTRCLTLAQVGDDWQCQLQITFLT